MMKRYLLLAVMLLASNMLSAQYLQDINGRNVSEKDYKEVQGTPYLYEDWKKGTVKLKNGKSYKDLDLKYDLAADELLFKDRKENVLAFADEVTEFSLENELYRSGYQAVDGRTEKTFYRVLSDGGTAFIKRQNKTIMEEKPFNSATTIKKFLASESYYLVKDRQLLKIKKDKKALLEGLGSKIPELEKFIASNKLNLKNDNDIARLVGYYNSL